MPKLLEWAFALLETSTNRGTLPHAIIILNRSDSDIKDELWTLRAAKEDLLAANSHVLESIDDRLVNCANKWRRRGKQIDNILDLIHCYYASFNVVRFPDKNNIFLLAQQVTRLRLLISKLCEISYLNKKEARFLASADDFGFYIQQAFTHFSCELDYPFDFKEAALKRSAMPQNIGDHTLRLAIFIQAQFPDKTGLWIFERLGFMVAACFLYECVSYRQGDYI